MRFQLSRRRKDMFWTSVHTKARNERRKKITLGKNTEKWGNRPLDRMQNHPQVTTLDKAKIIQKQLLLSIKPPYVTI